MTDAPYKRIAVASTFSPRFLQVLAEAKRIRERLGAELNLIYVGERSDEIGARFRDALTQLALPADSPIYFHQNDDPAVAILDAINANEIEMIVAGALEKEVVLLPFLGNVARRLVREANCSVMLFTQPEETPKPLRRIVFMADHSEHGRLALQRTFHLASQEKCERLYVVTVYTSFDEARAARGEEGARSLEQEEQALEQFVLSAGDTEVPIEAHCVRGNTAYSALDFVRSMEANLLVVPVESAGELPSHVSWIADTIPCNLWVVR